MSDYDYDLPDDFAAVIEPPTFAADAVKRALSPVTVTQLLTMRAASDDDGTPKYYAVRAKAFAPTTGQRYEMLVHNPPDGSYTMTYSYSAIPAALTSTNKYPVAPACHSETILESVLAVAESTMNDNEGVHAARFQARLAASVNADRAGLAA